MFESHFGLKCNPFTVTPDPTFLFLSQKHRDALHMLEYALVQGAPITVISGEIGCGKTILTRELIAQLSDSHTIGLINNTYPGMTHVMKWVARAFDIDTAGFDEQDCYEAIQRLAIEEYGAGRSLLLIVDEAQNLSIDGLESLRILTNMNNDADLILQLVLLGQPGLVPKLRSPALRQLVQRVGAEAELGPMRLHETRGYIRHRIGVAGGSGDLFDAFACAGIHHYSGGVPRLVNRLCERALVYGYAEGLPSVDLSLVVDVAEEQTRAAIGL